MGEQTNTNWINAKYAHIRIPKALLNNEKYEHLTPEAILLYGAMMDRTSLSMRYGGKQFVSPSNEFVIIYQQRDIMKLLRCKRDKARLVTKELVDSNLISLQRRKWQGPYIITVLPQNWAEYSTSRTAGIIPLEPVPEKSPGNNGKIDIPEDENIGISKGEKTDLNNPNVINLESINTNESAEIIIMETDDYKQLTAQYCLSHVNRILTILKDLFSFSPESIFVHGEEMAWDAIEPLFRSLSLADYQFVLQKMKKAKYTSEFSEAYILDALYAAVYMRSERDRKET